MPRQRNVYRERQALTHAGGCGYLPQSRRRLAHANRGHVSLGQLKVMSAIERCRTAALGGHVAAARTKPAAIPTSHTTAAATGTARSVKGARRANGWPSARPSFCPCPISTWCSRCPPASPISPSRTRRRSTAFCSRLRPRPCSRSPPIPSISAPGSASSRCCTPGDRRSPIIRMCI